jgi:hypothetical protein
MYIYLYTARERENIYVYRREELVIQLQRSKWETSSRYTNPCRSIKDRKNNSEAPKKWTMRAHGMQEGNIREWKWLQQ